MIKCPFCHFDNEDGALFCERCTSDLSGVAASAPPPPIAMAEPYAEPIAIAEPYAEPIAMAEPLPFEAIPVAEAQPFDFSAPAAVPLEPLALEPVAPPPPPPAVPVAAIPAAPAIPVAPAVPAGGLPAGAQPRLVVLRGQKRNVEYPIYEGHNYIGRADDKPVDIDLEDQEPVDRVWCSRQHACISFDENQLVIEDLNSANGTYVNRTRVYPGQKRELSPNDIVQIGNVQLKVVV